jgi:hypothetical protein
VLERARQDGGTGELDAAEQARAAEADVERERMRNGHLLAEWADRENVAVQVFREAPAVVLDAVLPKVDEPSMSVPPAPAYAKRCAGCELLHGCSVSGWPRAARETASRRRRMIIVLAL